MTSFQKLMQLRQEMLKENIDAFIIPKADEHQGEYVPPYSEIPKPMNIKANMLPLLQKGSYGLLALMAAPDFLLFYSRKLPFLSMEDIPFRLHNRLIHLVLKLSPLRKSLVPLGLLNT